MHDPLDKAAAIRGHLARAARYASILFRRSVSESELRSDADHLASAYERLPMPRADQCAVEPEDGKLLIIHPLSAERETITVALDEEAVSEMLRCLASPEASVKTRFLTLWRLAPERLPGGLRHQPAETRCPDHTLWHHLDTTAAVAWALRRGGPALLSFKLGPVQPFIEAARSLRDLLSGSYLLSTLVFAAIEPVLETCGPTALIYPALRRVPLADLWLHEQGVSIPRPRDEALARPCLPHRFLALVPNDLTSDLIARTRDAALTKWKEIAGAVWRRLKDKLDPYWEGWDRLWGSQIESYFDARAVALPIRAADPEPLLGAAASRRFEPLSRLGWTGGSLPGSWQHAVEISAALMEAVSQIAHVPAYRPPGEVPQKCTLLGTYEQMGPSRLRDSARFFEDGVGFEKGTDRLCAVSLVKRFCFPYYFQQRLGLRADVFRFADTAEVARRAGEKVVYYAVIAADGDEMRGWLSGAKSPRVRDVLHPRAVEFHERDPEKAIALELPRPVSPALHSAISDALNRFATIIVPNLIEDKQGVLVYAGGDDLLAVVPLHTVLSCALELRRAFSRFDVMGSKAGLSAGVVVAHYKDNMREAIRTARAALKRAKDEGRDRVAVAILRRSGEFTEALCRWSYVPVLERQRKSFEAGASDRWTYQLRRQMSVLGALPPEAFRAELKRLLGRSEHRDPRFLEDWDVYCEVENSSSPCEKASSLLSDPAAVLMEGFLNLCQSASFLARGREVRL